MYRYASYNTNALIARKTPYRDIALFPAKTLDYPYPLTSVFATSPTVPLSRAASMIGTPIGRGEDIPSGEGSPSNMLTTLRVVDYRYSRFALDPRSGLFNMIRYDFQF